jgi:hypothetical protein
MSKLPGRTLKAISTGVWVVEKRLRSWSLLAALASLGGCQRLYVQKKISIENEP